MNWIKNLDIKSWAIIVLGVALIISFFFGQKSRIDTHADEIKALHEANAQLSSKNDSLKMVNAKIDLILSDINKKIDNNTEALVSTKKELQDLKKKQNEIPSYVNRLSANDVANSFSKYLTKGSSSH